jgi:hypothetical protein
MSSTDGSIHSFACPAPFNCRPTPHAPVLAASRAQFATRTISSAIRVHVAMLQTPIRPLASIALPVPPPFRVSI